MIMSQLASAHRPGLGRVVARAAPGAMQHLGRRSFGGSSHGRRQFRPSGVPREPGQGELQEKPTPAQAATWGASKAGTESTGQKAAADRPKAPGLGAGMRESGPEQAAAAQERGPMLTKGGTSTVVARDAADAAMGTDELPAQGPERRALAGAEQPAMSQAGGSVGTLENEDTAGAGGTAPSAAARKTSADDDELEEWMSGRRDAPASAPTVSTPATARRPRQGPPREMLINAADEEEVRIAVVSGGQLEEFYTERTSTELHVGNIYKGKVANVEPSLQAAFIDFGIGRSGFLHLSDLHPQYFPGHGRGGAVGKPSAASRQGSVAAAEGEGAAAAYELEAPEGVYEEADPRLAGEWSDATDLQVDNAHLLPMEKVGRKTPRHSRPPIQQCLRRGQEIIVQVIKEGIGAKGPSLTSYISVPGRYLVMMPGMSQLGVSRKIEDLQQRRALKKILEDLHPPKNLGFIIRTAGIDRNRRELEQDLHYLVRVWKRISQRLEALPAPVDLYQESDLVIRTIRDFAVDDIDRIIVDEPGVAERIRDFLSIVNPQTANLVQIYTDPLPLFQRHRVEPEIEKINARRVELANGGSLVIDSAEALVAIDVNSGRYRAQRDAELSAFNINRDAIPEICRQLRLRDLGGVIVIDFIDMRQDRHKRQIEHLLREELKNDRAKTKVLRMSQFCMIEMTRQRVKPSLQRSLYQDCPHCHGAALIKTPESVSLEVLRRLASLLLDPRIARLEVRLHGSVATWLLNRKRKRLTALEELAQKKITILADNNLAGEAVLLEAFDVRGNVLAGV